jgi:hypothetical protein
MATWEEEPGWLDEDSPPDPEGDERDWPGIAELAEIQTQA